MKNQPNESGSPSLNKAFGDGGETLAEEYLKKQGFRVLERKYRSFWGEIDLIMANGPVVVFIEVKRRSNEHYGEPEEAVTSSKKNHIIKAALQYIQKKGTGEQILRFDVVCISGEEIRHYPNAFESNAGFWF